MKLQDIGTPVSTIAGVGPSLEKLLARLGIFTVSDLLSYWPKTWEDRTRKIPLSAWNSTSKVHTIAQVLRHDWFGFGRMRTLKIIIDDGTASAALVCFNRSFLEKSLPVGSVIAVTGRFAPRYGEIQTSAFEATCLAKSASIDEFLDKPVPGSAVFPIYPLTAGLSQTQLRKVIGKALKEYCRGIENELPESIIEKRGLMLKKEAVFSMHEPRNIEMAEKAKYSLIYEELYHFQETILRRSQEHRKTAAEAMKTADGSKKTFEETLSPRQKQLLDRLPFELTEDQKKVIYEMNFDIDLSNNQPDISADNAVPARFHMSRLLQGDVGSGKTLAAFFAALRTIDYGGQCVMMAPTEILARQHANNAAKLLEPLGIKVAFLTGNLKASGRTPLLSALKNGDIDIVIGTHAVFSQSVLYHDLRFVIIDEQHRFGVVQRSAVLDKGRQSVVQREKLANGIMPRSPDFLLMSATPIPQTLAHTIFGDLDISIIKSMPAGRQPIKTYLTKEGNESRVYEAVRQELRNGHQAYFVYPLIESLTDDADDSEDFTEPRESSKERGPQTSGTASTLKSAEAMFSFLSQKVYPEFKCALIHSKTDEADQIAVLESFRKGETQVLVATSVVEVGVDVPNATCMVIEHAERFGLAALHQLRGRVGRGTAASFCFLVYSEKLTELGKSRLKVLHESTDGFYIGEEDLKLRGPGDVNGIQQSGYITLGIADPVRDKSILELARADILETIGN
ncbi:MAG: ATP-dependent DNA helicase RecG [Spirochaetaceae bacterium]|nr:ATP-dependent DNA helicase RecG [Spirochaetaceae bacterium]